MFKYRQTYEAPRVSPSRAYTRFPTQEEPEGFACRQPCWNSMDVPPHLVNDGRLRASFERTPEVVDAPDCVFVSSRSREAVQ